MNLLEYCRSQKRAALAIERLKKQDMILIYAGASERRLLLKRVFDESGASPRYILRLLNESGLCPEHFGLETLFCSREREKSNVCKICFRRSLINHHIINEEESDI